MTTARERAESTVAIRNLEQAQQRVLTNKAGQLFDTFTTWFDAQPAEALENITDFPDYPNCRGVRISGGQVRWTFAKEPVSQDKPNLPIVAHFEYWQDEHAVGNGQPQYAESYLLYKKEIRRGDSTYQTIEALDEIEDLSRQINAIVQTGPIVPAAQGKK